jgi:iodotyrosine deiodinase
MSDQIFVPYSGYQEYPVERMKQRAADFLALVKRRRSVRRFSNRPVPVDIIRTCIQAAASAPSGADNQPWTFVVVAEQEIKKQIHQAAEAVEREFYRAEATKKWVQALDHLGTDPFKPFLLEAPFLIVIFAQRYSHDAEGRKKKHYYVQQSVGIATGILITALHHAGLASLPYTPARMAFLNTLLSRPANEKPFMILVTGYPADAVQVPSLRKKSLEEVAIFL